MPLFLMVTLLYLAQEQVYDGGIRVNGKWLKKIRFSYKSFFRRSALSSRPARLAYLADYEKGVRVNDKWLAWFVAVSLPAFVSILEWKPIRLFRVMRDIGCVEIVAPIVEFEAKNKLFEVFASSSLCCWPAWAHRSRWILWFHLLKKRGKIQISRNEKFTKPLDNHFCTK